MTEVTTDDVGALTPEQGATGALGKILGLIGKAVRWYFRAVFTPLTDEEKDATITWT
jgi:hypothetical protein